MKRILTFLLLCAAIFVCADLQAQDPIISIQGTLKDANGASVDDGERSVIFRLYDVTTGGTALWEETATVNVIGGIYSHNLGTVVPLVEANFATTVYLGVEVGGLELSPRTEMTYAPYALSVLTAQRVARGACSGQVGDIKHSILNPTQFAEENGECWVPMDGRAIPGTALASYGHANVPDMSGLFIRATEYNDGNDSGRSPMAAATVQGDENKEHDHPHNISVDFGGAHRHYVSIERDYAYADGDSGEGVNFVDFDDDDFSPKNIFTSTDSNYNGSHSHTISGTVQNSGGPETRPKNMNFYIYIRVD